MDLRRADYADIPRMIDLTEALVSAINGPQKVDRAYTGARLAGILSSADGFAMVSRDGFLAGMMMPTIISPKACAMELGWFARDGAGIHLLRRFEGWASDKGAALTMITTRGRDLSRLGYRRAEEVWVK